MVNAGKYLALGSILLFLSIGTAHQQKTTVFHSLNTETPEKKLPEKKLKHIIDSLNIRKSDLVIKIYKSSYLLEVVHKDKVLKSFPVVFGFNPVDDKLKQGDGCTPEGTFGIRAMYPHAKWSKFIWIDYPNKASWEKHKKAKNDGTIPKNVGIGGEVGIHGVPQGFDYLIEERENWTLGCISLTNKDVDELYEVLGTGTTIKISQ